MKRATIFCMMFFCALGVFAQHRVNDIAEYGGWFKVRFEQNTRGDMLYFITQCYPDGDEYEVNGPEREALPLHMKIFCIAMSEQVFKDQMASMVMEEDGLYLQVTGFSFIVKFSMTEEEVLDLFGQDMVDLYKDQEW